MAGRLYWRLKDDRIRLLKLHPGVWDDSLTVDLFEADESFDYIALSYTWGSSRYSKSITINNIVKGITVNLDLALRAARLPKSPVVIWVDALCIDQENVLEKNHQVSIMHSIFASATKVWAYVGNSIDSSHRDHQNHTRTLGSQHAITYHLSDEKSKIDLTHDFEPLLSLKSQHLSPYQRNLCVFSLLRLLADPNLMPQDLYFLFAQGKPARKEKIQHLFEWLRKFVVASWWNRMWITQEVGVAQSLELAWGKASITFDTLEHVAKAWRQQNYSDMFGKDQAKVLDLLAKKVQTISELRQLQHLAYPSQSPELGYYERSLGSPLLWLLRTFRNRESSDPRDKIYALARLLAELRPDKNHLLSTSYQTHTKELFCRVVDHIMRETGIFWLTTSDLASKSHDGLPSWMPNWSDGYVNIDPQSVAWKVRLCHNASDIKLTVTDGTEDNEITTYNPQEYFLFLRRYQGHPRKHRVFQSPIYLEKSANHQVIVEHEIISSRGVLKNPYYIRCGSQFCSFIDCVSTPIEHNMSNFYEVIRSIQDARYSVSPKDLALDPFSRINLDCIGRALCFGTHYRASSIVRLEKCDIIDLSTYVLLIAERMNKDFSKTTFTPKWTEICWERTMRDTMALCDICRDFTSTICDACKSTAAMKSPMTTEEAWAQPEIIGIHKLASEVAPGNCIFMTLDDRLGLGPPTIKPGQRVCILGGGLCPYVLRKDEDSRLLGYPTFQLVGDCYLDEAPGWDPDLVETIALV